jgi:WYL domain
VFLAIPGRMELMCIHIVSIKNAIKKQKIYVKQKSFQIDRDTYKYSDHLENGIVKNKYEKDIEINYGSEKLNKIQDAIRSKNEISFLYTKESGAFEKRLVIPKRIQFNYVENRPTGKYYIIGFDLNRNAERVFRSL